MSVPTVACTNCGKNFTTDDLRGTNCRYCGTLFAHHARAAEQVAVINHMMADRNGNGIPDAYEGLVANAQANAMNQAFGMGMGGGHPYAQPFGAPPGVPYAGYAQANHVHAQVNRTMGKVMIIVIVSILLVTLLSVGLGAAMWMLH
jgi:hypothetical protein